MSDSSVPPQEACAPVSPTHLTGANTTVTGSAASARPAAQRRIRLEDPGPAASLLVLIALCGAMVASWWPLAPSSPSPAHWYGGVSNGAAGTYVVTQPDGNTTYQSVTSRLAFGAEAGAMLAEAFSPQANRFNGDSSGLSVMRRDYTNIAADGSLEKFSFVFLQEPGALSLASEVGGAPNAYDPPLPLLVEPLLIGSTQTVTGTYSNPSLPYTATNTLAARELVLVPAGRYTDCWRLEQRLEMPGIISDRRFWYCGGIGLVRAEYDDSNKKGTLRFELMVVSSAGIISNTPFDLPTPANSATATIADFNPTVPLETRWLFSTTGFGRGAVAPPIADREYILYPDSNGQVIALSRTQNGLAWRFQTRGNPTQPVITADLVLVGSSDSQLYALDRRTGALRWTFTTRDAISAAPVVAGEQVFVGSEDGYLYTLDRRTGALRWSYAVGSPIGASPAVDADSVYIGSDRGSVYALAQADGALRWQYAVDGAVIATPIAREGVLYVGEISGGMLALRAPREGTIGEQLWKAADGGVAAQLLVGDTLYFLSGFGGEVIHAVNVADGAERWRYRGNDIVSVPAILGDRLIVADEDRVVLLETTTGSVATMLNFSGNPPIQIGSDGHELFVARQSGSVHILTDGRTIPWAPEATWVSRLDGVVGLVGPIPWRDSLILPAHIPNVAQTTAAVFSINRATGAIQRLGDLGSGLPSATSAISGDTFFVLLNRGSPDGSTSLVAFNLAERRVLWAQPLGMTTGYFAPLIIGDQVFTFGTKDGRSVLISSALADGRQLWRRDLPASSFIPLIEHGGKVIVGADRVYALDPASGSTVWESEPSSMFVDFANDGDFIVALSYDNAGQPILHRLDGETGGQLSTTPVPLSPNNWPNLSGALASQDGVAVLAMNDGTLLALDTAESAERWRVVVTPQIQSRPLLGGWQRFVDSAAIEHNVTTQLS